ncbi:MULTISPECIES: alpha/beta fold hydrolase [Amycolatopsis]|uniref:Alpha/beta hydrolase family protein n=2 Tax=Amycolatopsis TaxID=1813 RepID=A0A1I3RGD6_9PSEU|nr:alpha/beta fold hydrolase [Amycolatopsis sacchari]SFJ45704.1 Alpha/beta hydrolase family protein [Amycolatopsis sacchari]
MRAGDQVVRFTAAGGRRVAWACAGSGPPLVLGGWWCGHLELDWRNPLFRRFTELFTDRFTLIRYDRPGTGMSGRTGPPPTSLAEEVAVLSAVVDEAGERVSLFGGSSGGCVAAAYAAEHPERVDRLVLYGSYAHGADIATAEARDSILAAVARHWGVGSRLLADVFLPGGTAAEREEFVRLQRASASPESAAASLAALYGFDVRDRLGTLETPALVVHRRDDRAIPFRLGQDVAARVGGATFVPLDGDDHLPWRGDVESVVRAVRDFLGAGPRAPATGGLSGREVEVLRLVAGGLSDREIAERLGISAHTVHRHVANIRTKLGLPTRTAIAVHAARSGLI